MTAVFAILCLSLGVVLFQFAYIHHRRPSPSRWTMSDLAANLITVTLVSAFVIGAGLLVKFGIEFQVQTFTALDVVWIVAVLSAAAVMFLLQRGFWLRWQASDVPTAASEPEGRSLPVANERGAPDDGTSGRPRRAA